MFVQEVLPEHTAYIENYGYFWKNENENEWVDEMS